MCKLKNIIAVMTFVSSLTSVGTAAETIKTHGGILMNTDEIKQWSITIYPDGRNLPAGSGDAVKGKAIYETNCLFCHGAGGDNGVATRLVGLQGGSKDPLRALSVGAWPNATSIYDFIQRGMPHHAPKTLSPSQVYSLTAYILNLNGLLSVRDELNSESLLKVEMPNKGISYSAWDVEEKGNIRGNIDE